MHCTKYKYCLLLKINIVIIILLFMTAGEYNLKKTNKNLQLFFFA